MDIVDTEKDDNGIEQKNKTVKIINEDGAERWTKQFCRRCSKDTGLISASDIDNKIYHIYLDCYEDWSEKYRALFKGWSEKKISELKEYRMCKRCEERLYRHDNPTAIITGYDFKYYYETFNDPNDYEFIDHFENDNNMLILFENDDEILEIYHKHMVLKSKKNSSIKNISYDIDNIDEYFNLKSIEFKETKEEDTKLLSIYYIPIMCHPKKEDFIFWFVNEDRFEECKKIIDYINNLVKRKKEISKNKKR